MTAVTVDQKTVEKLQAPGGPVQVRDERGVVVGEFRPTQAAFSPHGAAPDPPPARPKAFDEMIERMRRSAVSPAAFPIRREDLYDRRL
jgi:hypothetical protein